MKLKPTARETKLTREVRITINRNADGDPASWLRDLAYGGCASGMVGGLIYRTECLSFVARHLADVLELLAEYTEDMGEAPPVDWSDPQSWFAWFAFEETARRIADENGIEI